MARAGAARSLRDVMPKYKVGWVAPRVMYQCIASLFALHQL